MVGTNATQYLYDGLNPVQELNGAAPPVPTANLLTGLGVDEYFTRTDSSGNVSSLLRDALGSTIGLVGSGGTIATSYTYQPFRATTVGGSANGRRVLVQRKPRRPRSDRRGRRGRRPGRGSWSADIAAATTLSRPSKRDATPAAAPASRRAMARSCRARRLRALGRRRPPSSFGQRSNWIGGWAHRRLGQIARWERLRDSIERTPRQESTSPSYSIPSACSWALQSKRRSIRRESASTVSSTGWRQRDSPRPSAACAGCRLHR